MNWYIDATPEIIEHSLTIAKHYDYFFFSHSEGVRKNHDYGNSHVKLLHFACDPDIHKPCILDANEKKLHESEITFVGSYYPERERVLSNLLEYNLSI